MISENYSTADEISFIEASTSPNEIIETPIGNMKVLICADAWFRESYQNTKDKVDFVIVPSYSSGFNLWNKTWAGYSGFPTPQDAKSSVQKVTLVQAWE